MKTGVELITDERRRQIEVEGYDIEHDKQERCFKLSRAAGCYMFHAHQKSPMNWPWDTQYWKPSQDHVRNLVKAGALIAAEIDRILEERKTNPEFGRVET